MSLQDSQAVERLSNITSQMATARFGSIPLAPPDAILGIIRDSDASAQQ